MSEFHFDYGNYTPIVRCQQDITLLEHIDPSTKCRSKEVHMIHSYGVNVCVIVRKDTGITQINSYSALLVTLKTIIMPSITVILCDFRKYLMFLRLH